MCACTSTFSTVAAGESHRRATVHNYSYAIHQLVFMVKACVLTARYVHKQAHKRAMQERVSRTRDRCGERIRAGGTLTNSHGRETNKVERRRWTGTQNRIVRKRSNGVGVQMKKKKKRKIPPLARFGEKIRVSRSTRSFSLDPRFDSAPINARNSDNGERRTCLGEQNLHKYSKWENKRRVQLRE